MSSAPTINAIPTEYDGVWYRSRLEARWALLMDMLRIKYDYEPEGYDMGGTWYLPDFWLPEYDAFLEIKPGNWSDVSKSEQLVWTAQKPVLIGMRVPTGDDDDDNSPPYMKSIEFECTDSSCGLTTLNASIHLCDCGRVAFYKWSDDFIPERIERAIHPGPCSGERLDSQKWGEVWMDLVGAMHKASKAQFR